MGEPKPKKPVCAQDSEHVIEVWNYDSTLQIVCYKTDNPLWYRCLIYTSDTVELDRGPCSLGWEGEDPTSWRAAREMAMRQAGMM